MPVTVAAPFPAGTRDRLAGPVSPASLPLFRNTTRSAQAACRTLWVTSTTAQPVGAPLAEQAHHRFAGERVEGPCRLVRQQQRPPSSDRAGDRHPLLLTPGQLGGEPAPDGSQAQGVQQAAGARHGRLRPDPVQFQCDRHVLGGGQRPEQVGLLEHEADLPPRAYPRARPRPAWPGRGRPAGSGRTLGRSSPPASRSSVDLPDPLGPMTATNSPGPARSDTSSRAATRRCPDP